MNGHASNIAVVLHKDRSSMTIQDDGRGIPVDKHPHTKTSALEIVFTKLHAGGKFDGQNYKTAGGLHGVGASVVNALSRELVATVRRDGATWEQKYRLGTPVGPVKKIGPARGTGTTVFFHPDPTIFPKTEFDAAVIRERIEIASYLHRGLKIVFENEAPEAGQPGREVFQHDEGIGDYLSKLLADRGASSVHETPFAFAREHDETGLRLDRRRCRPSTGSSARTSSGWRSSPGRNPPRTASTFPRRSGSSTRTTTTSRRSRTASSNTSRCCR
jgi:DNA gyrase subunit B/topoisomerase-4 subunit B